MTALDRVEETSGGGGRKLREGTWEEGEEGRGWSGGKHDERRGK